jgi:chemotaxis protein methyltransferase CheR
MNEWNEALSDSFRWMPDRRIAERRYSSASSQWGRTMPMTTRVHRILELLSDIERHARVLLQGDAEDARRIITLVGEARDEARHLEERNHSHRAMTAPSPVGRVASPSVAFLQWALPRLGLRWSGFRRVRRQVWRRIGRRIADMHLSGPDAYRSYLESHPEEWAVLDSFCRIPISRFLRDRAVFERLATDVLPTLADGALQRGDARVRCWSAGCASGEEPYSLVLLWHFELRPRYPGIACHVLATDVEESLLARARAARYRRSSLREVPEEWIESAFTRDGEWFELRTEFCWSAT